MVRSVLITGASSGIGARTAEWLADRGFQVFGTSRKPQPDAGGPISWVAMDVRDEPSVRKAVAQVLEAVPKLDAVVCNAGYGIFGSVEEVDLESAVQQFDTNFFGVLRTLRAVLPGMREAGSGRVVLVGSLAGRVPIPFQGHYSASKAAVDALALALHNEVFASGVRVSLVEPGDIATPFNDAMDWGETGPSAYGDAIRTTQRVIEEALPLAPGPDRVARVIHHALTARRPRVRYAVGREALPVALARRLFPDRWTLALIRRNFHL